MASFFSKIRESLLKGKAEKEPTKKVRPVSHKKVPRRKTPPISSAKVQALLVQAEKDAARIKVEAEAQASKIKEEAQNLKNELLSQKAEISRKAGILEERERVLTDRTRQLEERLVEVETAKKEQVVKLEKIASLSREEAKSLIMAGMEKKLAPEIAERIKAVEEEIKAESERRAKEILVEAMQRGVTDYVVEYTVSTVKLADEEIKGRIIGREGRNIRTFEQATGVELELDESNEVYLSSFDPVRREVARRSLERLIKDRRIRPSMIEEVVERTKKEMEKILLEEGEKLCREARVFRLHPDLVKMLGRYKFRFSYGQNMAVHTLEVVKIGVAIANQVRANVNVVRLACLLHDIGKVITEEEGTHVELGTELVKKYRLPSEVIDCIAQHHEDQTFSSAESRIVWVADAISGARPGARYEPHEEYVKRMTEVEEAASSFEGVKAAYAYQAGREVRVMVAPEKVPDSELPLLARKIKEELEKKVAYVGQIKITCIREARAADTTRAK
jgi:ribonuclease Y